MQVNLRPAYRSLRSLWRYSHAAILASLIASATANAQCDAQELLPDDPELFQYFGNDVGLSGNLAVVGARNDSDIASDAGSVYAFERVGTTWTQVQEMYASDAANGSRFGWSLHLVGTRLIVGSPNSDAAGSSSGSAYIFEHDGVSWSQTQLLTASDAEAGDGFGDDVYLWADLAFVGASGDNAVAPGGGAVYVYQYTGANWVEIDHITGSDTGANDSFGSDIAVDDDTLVVGARFDDDLGPSTGTVFVFERNAGVWNEVAKLHSSQPGDFRFFGSAVSISVDTILVGGDNENHQGVDSGAAYVFEREANGWSVPTVILPDDGAPQDSFGWSVDVQGNHAIVGAINAKVGGVDTGAAYLFERNGSVWMQTNKFVPTDGGVDDNFAWSVEVNDTDALMGSFNHNHAHTDSGAAYSFALESGISTNYCVGALNSVGTGANLTMTGTPTVSNNDMGLFVTSAVPNRPGLFFYGPNQIQLPFGEGWRCVGGSIFRLPPAVVTDITGSASKAVDFTVAPAGGGGPGAIVAGSDWNFQFWYRDPAGGPFGFNLSDGLNVVFCP